MTDKSAFLLPIKHFTSARAPEGRGRAVQPVDGPKVYILTHEFFPRRGGIATFTEEMACAAARLGHSVEVWAQEAPPGTDAERPWPFTVRRLDLRGTHGFRCRWAHGRQLAGERRRLRRSQVYLCEPGPMLALMPLLAFDTFRPRRLTLTFHGSEIQRFHASPVTRWLTRRLIRHAEQVSVLTEFTEKLLVERFPEAKNKVFRTPGALRNGFWATFPRTQKPAAAGARLVVLTVGRLHPRKGQLQTLEALMRLPADLRTRIEYRLVGVASQPEHERVLRETAKCADFPVLFLGGLDDEALAAAYAHADVFALTSRDHGHSVEGFGLVYLEASAHGLPVVAHLVGGVSEAVADGVSGLLVPPDRPVELTQAFARLITDADLRLRLGAAGPDFARRHSWDHSAQLLFGTPDEGVPGEVRL